MKKLCTFLFSILFLSGCGGEGNRSESMTCTVNLSEAEGITTFHAVDNEIMQVDMELSIPASIFSSYDFADLSNDQKKSLSDSSLSAFGLEEQKGIELQTDFSEDYLTVSLKIHVDELDSDALDAIEFLDLNNNSLQEQVEIIENNGGECK